MIHYGHQEIDQSDIDVVVDVLRSEYLTQGPVVPRFEEATRTLVNARYAVAVNSATSALHIACLALELQPGDRLWTVPNTFVASANCARYCGADVDFVDIDPNTWNLSVERLREKLVRAKKEGRLPKVLVPVHFAGQPTEQEAIWDLAKEYGFRVLEDASHAIGASRNSEPVGSCRWSDIAVFSFHPVKIITTGEGGMALTNDAQLAKRMVMLRSHGITRDPAWRRDVERGMVSGSSAPELQSALWYYEQQMLGFNYRMTEIPGALGISQLRRLKGFVERRNVLARRYDEVLKELPLQLPTVQPENRSAFHLYAIRIRSNDAGKTHRRVFDALWDGGIGANVHYMPVHLQPYYRKLGFAPGQFPEAEAHGSSAISLPLYPGLTDQQQSQVVDCLNKVLGR